MDRVKELEQKIGYVFKDKSLIERALMHSSYTNEKHLKKYECNERLEFLGDAVLELISSDFLYKKYIQRYIPGLLHIPRLMLYFQILHSWLSQLPLLTLTDSLT